MSTHSISWIRVFAPVIPITLLPAMAMLAYYIKKSRPIRWLRVLTVVITIAPLSAGLIWVLWGRQAQIESAVLFGSPISSTRYIRVDPARYFSLVDGAIIITNAATIYNIMAAIQSAKPYFPRHPDARWQCFLVISNAQGVCSFKIRDTSNQGTILYTVEQTRRSDIIGDVLENATERREGR